MFPNQSMGHIKKARTLLNQRFAPICMNIGYVAFFTDDENRYGTVIYTC
ncbi:hypothetical protein B857_01539 [Solibacillus isronensis B3W22]|uniref:Uncharacterized protein n=1 Tax=Solibacillus isronensis B3W22 TaxID=1224748 RepID=K1L4M3_9BACL|nr:hypothetical protein B857_01539 [Solibacillus isronensis B3W22]